MLKTVQVTGDPQALWQTLLRVLQAYGYEIESQQPYVELKAHRGSKLTSLFTEGTKGGYRDLRVAFLPQGPGCFDARFEFIFPFWAITLPGTSRECSQMVDEFASLAEQGQAPVQFAAGPTPVPAGGTKACPSCGTQLPEGAKFCSSCGATLGARLCPKCGASLQPTARFCDNCGAPV